MRITATAGTDSLGQATQPPRFSLSYMDRSVDPRKDLYSYACGRWLKENPVPPNKTEWGTLTILHEWNLSLLRKIAEESASDKGALAGSYESRIGNFYTSAMDIGRINAAKFAPVDDLWQTVEGIGSTAEIAPALPKLYSTGAYALFDIGCNADEKESGTYAFHIWQGGLSLPDREYYLSDKFSVLRGQFTEHMTKMFSMKGVDDKSAREWAGSVLAIETDIAKAARAKADLRDPVKNYNKVDIAQFDLAHPNLGLKRFMKAIGMPDIQLVIVGQPEFIDALDAMLVQKGVEQWKAYLRWHVLCAFSPFLHKEVRDERFDFFKRKLLGQQEPEPEWKRSLAVIDSEIGEALGKLYVDRYFNQVAKARAEALVGDIVSAFRKKLEKVAWMSEATRGRALEKLDKMKVKLGYPKKFREYTGLAVSPDDYVGNIRRSEEFELRRETARIGKPVDRAEWEMTPPTVNAYYSQTNNEMVLPAGIMQPPFFDMEMDDAVNYAGIGTVIGHELTHGFDDQGRKFDADGNLNEWWTEEDAKAFERRAKAVSDAYDAIEPLPGIRVNGRLVLGEAIADLGGVSIALDALQERLAAEPSKRKVIDGFTPEQRFLIAFAQIWRENIREDMQLMLLLSDPHPPEKYRAIISAMDVPAFSEAFPPKEGEPPRKRIGLW